MANIPVCCNNDLFGRSFDIPGGQFGLTISHLYSVNCLIMVKKRFEENIYFPVVMNWFNCKFYSPNQFAIQSVAFGQSLDREVVNNKFL